MEGWLAGAAERFWNSVGTVPSFPRDLEDVVGLGYPVTCKALSNLRVASVERWMAGRGIPFHAPCRDRALFGCIVGVRGKGIIFYSRDDSAAERRFTIAHEAAHFVLDYLEPRRHALHELGPSILPVLDGERRPVREERIDALLGRVKLGVYMDLMPRADDGGVDRQSILRAENRADRLALELLAPGATVLSFLLDTAGRAERVLAARGVLAGAFGLPPEVARRYAAWLLRPEARVTLADWLGAHPAPLASRRGGRR